MALISQPGSDYQIASISLDAGYTWVSPRNVDTSP